MIEKHIKYKIHLIILLVTLVSNAQQDPQYTQYMYNMSVINPGYATDDAEVINFGALYRAQWVGSEGGPTTGTFFAHSPIAKKVEMGISVVHDEIGDVVKESNVFVDFAYVLNLNESNKLSFGIKGGATFYSTNFNGFIYSDELPDPAFAENLSKTFPNIGVGAFYFGENYYLGLSSPNLLKSKHLEKQDGVIATGVEEIHYFFTGGYVFNLNDNLKFKPAFMTKAVAGAPMSLDLTANFLINNVFELGAGYRWDDSVSGLVNFKITPSLRIGYAYDYTLSNLGKFNTGSHEIMLLFDLNKKGKTNGYDKSPRFF
ncbi:MAG TPA: type IX secretion system membrane protein PorP/SprF [Flavobacterium sp.]|jgi:type IX secretion system PorP/SprF family membrane protein|nr:type IX secretion system membrane protein PorP/SprF [Flavobacterium sp.]HRZ32258.1 type IX secretion system membrane protein PorP/SprF [Flavobacterium sp.]HRZ74881.1 type IX secretion system membrane protein PorP/SprF [Flavobacterium sp.]